MSENKESKTKIDSSSCPLKECVHQGECAIIEITKKVPKPGGKCSYFDKDKSRRFRKHNGKEDKDDDV